MKPVRIIFIAIFLLMVAVLSAPMWGGCGLNYQLCTLWCDIRHFGSSFESVACKGGCSAEQLACRAK